jgi:CheY-like chemotaxis protein
VSGYTEPAEALQAFAAAPGEFDMVITDTNMPQMTGLDVAAKILKTRPDIPLVLTSGYIRPEDVESARSLGVRHVILKPDSVTQFGALVHRCLAKH